MICVIKQTEIDPTKTTQKWKPILEKVNVPENLIQTVAMYCESHSLIEAANVHYMPIPGIFDTGSSQQDHTNNTLLPESLRILSKLNLTDKNVQITSSPTFHYIDANNTFRTGSVGSVEVSMDYVENIQSEEIKHQLMDEMAATINKQLEDYNSIVLYLLVTRISSVSEKNGTPKIILTSRFSLFDPKDPSKVEELNTKSALSQYTNEQLLAELSSRLNTIKEQVNI